MIMRDLGGAAGWEKLGEIFGRLLDSSDPERDLAAITDPGLQHRARELWMHHLAAGATEFMDEAPPVAALPVFEKGQRLSGRFVIERQLGAGGMGEVYLATDERLGGPVAVKAVARLLSYLEPVRRRFIAEVQAARRVSHPNVCRIHDLFEDGETPYFTMEYLAGPALDVWLAGHTPEPPQARQWLRDIAQGVAAAHAKGVLHGDLKPGNVILSDPAGGRAIVTDFGMARVATSAPNDPARHFTMRAGTAGYLAPEVAQGGPLSVASDIYALGRIAALLLPKDSFWRTSVALRPEDRPKSVEAAMAALGPPNYRRYLIGAGLITSGSLATGLWRLAASRVLLPIGSLLLVSSVQAADELTAQARTVRELLLTALRQSSRLHLVPERDILSGLAPDSAFRLDSRLAGTAGRLRWETTVRRAHSTAALLQSSFTTAGSALDLAEQASGWLRRSAGESEESMRRGSVPLATLTSSVPEALDRYAEAMQAYHAMQPQQAMPLLGEAIRLDPKFAQPHAILGLCHNTQHRFREAVDELETAVRLGSALPDREKAVITGSYYKLTEDPVRMVAEARKNAALFPQDSWYHRWLAHTLAWTGAAAEAVEHARRACALSPGSEINRLELIVTTCEAGDFATGLQEFQNARAAGLTGRQLERGAGLAYLGLEKYDDARQAFMNQGQPERLLYGAEFLRGAIEVAIAGWRRGRVGARAADSPVAAHEFAEHLAGSYFLLGQPGAAARELADGPPLDAAPPNARRIQAALFWASRLGQPSMVASGRASLEAIARRWPNSHTAGLLRYAQALDARSAGDLDAADAALTEALGRTYSVLALIEAAEVAAERGQFALADDYWAKFEERRGTVLKLGFPGLLLYGWHGRMAAAQRRGDQARAREAAGRILRHWSGAAPQAPLVQAAKQVLGG